MKRLIALTTVVAALGVGVSGATAARPSANDQGVKLCQRQGGSWSSNSGISYGCQTLFTERELSQAARLCERNGGLFVPGLNRYDCFLTL